MSKTVEQVFVANPTTIVADTDLYYLVQSPYTPGTDAAITGASLKAVFGMGGTINPGSANQLGYYATSGSTISGLGTANNGVLVTSAGGVPSISSTLPAAVQGNITALGTIATGVWNGSIIGLTYGGTNAALTANNGGIFYSTATAGAILAGTATARQMLQSGATAAPAWSTTTWPATTTANQILFSSAANTISEITTAASAVLITSAGSVPSLSSTLPTAVQSNITQLGAQTQALNMNTHLINNLVDGIAASDAATVGQVTAASSPLTTKGDLYTFTTVNARLPVGGTNGQVLQVASGAATGLAWSTTTYPATALNAARILRSNGTNYVDTTSTFADTYAASGFLYANGANNVAGLATANNGLPVTNNTGVPSILAGPGTTGNILISNAAAAPSFTTFTYPTTVGATGSIHISNGTNIVSSTSLWPNTVGASGKVVISDGTSNVYSTPTFPNASATTRKIIVSDGTNWVASTETYAVPGTSGNVLTSDGTNWISSVPASTSLLTTKGDLFSFSTVDARLPVATGDGKVLQVSSGAATGLAYSTPTYPSASGTSGKILISDGTNNVYSTPTYPNSASGTGTLLRADGTNWVATTTTYPNTNAINTLLYASSANVMSALATATTAVLTTSSGVPTWATNLSLTLGGTNASLTASNGGIFYSTASAGAILAGTATAGLALLSGASTTPTWSTSKPITQIGFQVFNASGANTYTPTAGTTIAFVQLWGAGGGGGSTNSAVVSGSGGGGGAYTVLSVTNPTAITISIGTGGSGQAANNGTASTNGGDTTYNSTTGVAKGGTGAGSGGSTGGAGGVGASGTGDIKISGSQGNTQSIAGINLFGGNAGGTILPVPTISPAVGSNAPANSGAGGAGGNLSTAAGNGGSGYCIVTEFRSA